MNRVTLNYFEQLVSEPTNYFYGCLLFFVDESVLFLKESILGIIDHQI